jgi:ABC-type sulfate transport system permease component
MPVFSAYTAAVLPFIVRDKNVLTDTSPQVTRAYAGLLFIVPTILATVRMAAISLQAFRKAFENFEDFKIFLMTVESAFAVYANTLVFAIFNRPQDTARTDRRKPTPKPAPTAQARQ